MSEEATETERQDEQELIAGFLRWAQSNCVALEHYSYGELREYICRYLKAAG